MRARTYPGSVRVALPGRDHEFGPLTFGAALKRRRSVRDFTRAPLEAVSLGRLLYTAYGVKGLRQVDDNWAYDRPIPSAGGLYPLEVYVATSRVSGLADGIYHYDARSHELEARRDGNVLDTLADMTIDQVMLRDANVVVLTSCVAERTMWKYGQRGYRYVWIEAGHLGQNIYLAAAGMNLGAVAIGGFFDDEVGKLFKLPGGEVPIYLICIGIPRPA
jgi:SagB-type dehydrogenase family enzyme